MFEITVVNEPSVFEPPKIYCTFNYFIDPTIEKKMFLFPIFLIINNVLQKALRKESNKMHLLASSSLSVLSPILYASGEAIIKKIHSCFPLKC